MQDQPTLDEIKDHLRGHLASLTDDALVQTFLDLGTIAQNAASGHARELADLYKVASTALLTRFCPEEFGHALALHEEFAV